MGEAVMPSSITPALIGAQPPVERVEAIAQEAPTNRYESPLSETEFRLRDRQQLRRIFLGN
jgi:hypothetical protein